MKVLESLVLAFAQIVTTDSFPPGLYLRAVILCESMSSRVQLAISTHTLAATAWGQPAVATHTLAATVGAEFWGGLLQELRYGSQLEMMLTILQHIGCPSVTKNDVL